MKKILSLLMLFMLTVPAIMAVTTNEKVDMWPFVVSFEIDIPKENYEIIINDPLQAMDCINYNFDVKSTALDGDIYVMIDDYNTPQGVSISELWARLTNMNGAASSRTLTVLPFPIGGRPGVLGEIAFKETGEIDYYDADAIYSPDGVGNRGSVIADITSYYPENTTKTFLRKLKINRVA